MITGGSGPDVPHSPERGGPSQTKKRSLGESQRSPSSPMAADDRTALHQPAGILALRPVNFGGVGRGAPLVFWGSVAGWTGDIARCAMALVKGQTCRLNGPVPQTCGLGSSEG